MADETGHVCNAYCVGPTHCDLVYTDWTTFPHALEQIRASYHYQLGLDVVRIEPGSEAPPVEAIPPGMQQKLGTRAREPGTQPWLVYWKQPDA